jgi:hypothetical protein
MGDLIHGSLDNSRPDYNSLADFRVSGNLVELRIPWMWLNFGDPSSRSIVWIDGKDNPKITEGIRATAISFRPMKDSPAASSTGRETNAADLLPRAFTSSAIKLYTWDQWDVPVYHMFKKKSFDAYKKVLANIPEVK